MNRWIIRHRGALILAGVALFHAGILLFARVDSPSSGDTDPAEYRVLKLVDVEEIIPPPETPITLVSNQPIASEHVVATDDVVIEVNDGAEPEYLPQHKISVVPEIPTKDVLSRIRYPSLALRQEIEGVVYLELFIDGSGTIRMIRVLKDPGFGFAEAAVEALTGMRCKPALANGKPVAVRFRYPVRFTLQR